MDKIQEYVTEAFRKALAAMNEKYKANRNPGVAALYDPDPMVRAGAAMFLCEMVEDTSLITPNTIPVLKAAIKQEKNGKAKVIMEAMLERIVTGNSGE